MNNSLTHKYKPIITTGEFCLMTNVEKLKEICIYHHNYEFCGQ